MAGDLSGMSAALQPHRLILIIPESHLCPHNLGKLLYSAWVHP